MIYCAAVAGLLLPLAVVRIRRRMGRSAWVVLTVPSITALAEVQAAVNGPVQVLDETGAEWLLATLTEVDMQRDPYSASLTLTARIINPPFVATTRTLSGVCDRDTDDNGKRTVTCDPLPALRPNDTVQDGVSSWLVGSIDLTWTPTTATMRVGEG